MYSQSTTINSITNFYRQILNHPSLPTNILILPPPSGWLSISPPTPTKTPTVLSLLRHLPYLRLSNYDPNSRIGIHYETLAIDYSTPTVNANIQFPESVYPLPDHCVYLTRSIDREGSALILDTEEGVITCMASNWRRIVSNEEYDKLEFEEQWMAFEKVGVEEFFESWIVRYRKLVWMLVPCREGQAMVGRFVGRPLTMGEEETVLRGKVVARGKWGSEAFGRQDRHAKEVYDMYLEYGWPDDFDKEACRVALLKLEEKSIEDERREMDELFPDPPGMFDSD